MKVDIHSAKLRSSKIPRVKIENGAFNCREKQTNKQANIDNHMNAGMSYQVKCFFLCVLNGTCYFSVEYKSS